MKNSGSFLLDNLTVVSKRKECVGEKNILGTYIVGNKLLISFEKDYWAIDVLMTSREVSEVYFEQISSRDSSI